MDKSEVTEILRSIATETRYSSQGAYLRRVANWLEQTETVEEVREALKRLEQRSSVIVPHYTITASGPGHVYELGGEVLAKAELSRRNFSATELIDSIPSPEPSSEPPDPSEIEPGECIPTKAGRPYDAFVYPYGKDEFTGVVYVWDGEYKSMNWDWKGVSRWPSDPPPTYDLDFNKWRKCNGYY